MMLKRFLKNERGLTLIELLAVVVILGIIAAIAVPAIGGLIDNSKKDAHLANARMMVSAAQLLVTGNTLTFTGTPTTAKVTMDDLEKKGYLEPVKNPSQASYDKTGSFVTITKTVDATTKITNYTYKVTLKPTGSTVNHLSDLDPNDAGTDREDITL